MFQKISRLGLLVCLAFAGCDSAEEKKPATNNSQDQVLFPGNPNAPATGVVPPAPSDAPAMGMQPATPPEGMGAIPPGQSMTTTAPGMNPPHGEPGHRCEIAVGAPLNSAPSTPPATATSPSLSMPPPQITTGGSPVEAKPILSPELTVPGSTPPAPGATTPVKTAPGMNPPHGEPGHDCSIAVGAPLKK
jgi:hypothetical protein